MPPQAQLRGSHASAKSRVSSVINSQKYRDARRRLGRRTTQGDLNELRQEIAEWSSTRKVANSHLR